MAFKSVSGRYNGPELEKRILDFWRANQIFEKSLAQSRDRPLYTFNEGPPTANGRPGIHHVLARSFKDIYPRFKTMQGFHVPRKAGWDTHGLPVEHEIEKELGIFDKKVIEGEIGVTDFNQRCQDFPFPDITHDRISTALIKVDNTNFFLDHLLVKNAEFFFNLMLNR